MALLVGCRWDHVEIEVDTAGETPVFSFDAPINKLEVWAVRDQTKCKSQVARNAGDNLWFIYQEVGPGVPETSFTGPVTYGVVPAEVIEDDPAVPLEAGTAYVLQVYLEAYDAEDFSFGSDAAGCVIFEL